MNVPSLSKPRLLLTSVSLLTLSSCAILPLGRRDPYEGLPPAQRRIAMAMDQRDLILGMGRRHVRASWGEPIRVETAGEEDSGHERWIYSTRLTNPAFKEFGQERVVYFEQGHVVGWESQ